MGLNHQPQNSKAREIRARSEAREIARAPRRARLRERPIRSEAPVPAPAWTGTVREKVGQVASGGLGRQRKECRPLAVSVLVSVVDVRRRSQG